MTRLVYFNHPNPPPTISAKIRQLLPDFRFDIYKKVLSLCWTPTFYARHGYSTLPFRYDAEFFKSPIPKNQRNFSLSFEEISDRRCQWIYENCHDLPWVVKWSGGIDSTVVLSSLIKNLPKADLKSIKIALNRVSIYENPWFFENLIRPNFQIIDVNGKNFFDTFGTHYIINGEPGDLLTGSGLALSASNSHIDLALDWKDHSGVLMDFLAGKVGIDAAQWFFDKAYENITSLSDDDPKIETLNDWFWWINFCWKWPDKIITGSYQTATGSSLDLSKLIPWYSNDEYQLWSINRGHHSLLLDGSDLGDYKKDSKKYISCIFKNQYFEKFKVKIASGSSGMGTKKVDRYILSDGSILDSAIHMQQISELMEDHIYH